MEKIFFIIFFFLISRCLCVQSHSLEESCPLQLDNNPFISYQVVDSQHESIHEVIRELLVLQNSLIVDNQLTAELPAAFKEKGFLTIRMDQEMIMDMLNRGGKIITAFYQNRLCGYLLLCKLSGFQWIKEAMRVDLVFHSNLDELEKYFFENQIDEIDQIAVDHAFAKQGIGTKMVDMAKQLSPHGLATSILYQPFTNEASLSFFSKQGFVFIANVHLLGKPPKCLTHEVYVELWVPI